MSEPTINSYLSDADLCRQNGWTVGTILEGTERNWTTRIVITAIGDSLILGKALAQNGEPVNDEEHMWTLSCREWKAVKP